MKVLLAEDNPMNPKVASIMLRRIGAIRWYVAANGVEVLEALEYSRYDVITDAPDEWHRDHPGHQAALACRGSGSTLEDS
jgi:hypothetical protein